MCRILESQAVGHVADRILPVEEQLLGRVDELQADVLLGRAARFAFDQITEVVGREAELPGAVAHRRQAERLRQVRSEVIVQDTLEAGEDVLVGNLAAREELPVVEARAVVEQHLDVVDDERAAVLVDGVLQLVEDVPHAVDDRLPLLLRKVQRLAHLVGEEGIAADVASELRAAQQIGMEEQRPTLRPVGPSVVLHAEELSGRQADERPGLVVVGLTAVDQIAAIHLLEEYGIETEHVQLRPHGRLQLRKVHHADQRVQGLDPHEVVVLEYMVQMQNGIHRVFGG